MTKRAGLSERDSRAWGETSRALVSIALFAHLFVVFVCLAANLAPSVLQQRLLRLFSPYARPLNFDLDGTRYFLTHGTSRDVDHRVEVLREAGAEGDESAWQWVGSGAPGSERYHRYQRLAEALAFFAEDDSVTALLAAGVARQAARYEGVPVREIRCRQHLLQSWMAVRSESPAERDPAAPSYFAYPYRARVMMGDGGQVRILKREAAALEAQPSGPR
jgi:hypothetical protein